MSRNENKGYKESNGRIVGGQVRHRRYSYSRLGRWLIGTLSTYHPWLLAFTPSTLPPSYLSDTILNSLRHTPRLTMHALEAQDALHAPAPATPEADVHHYAKGKPGYCAMRGNCGRATMFGAELPCPDDGKADKVSALSGWDLGRLPRTSASVRRGRELGRVGRAANPQTLRVDPHSVLETVTDPRSRPTSRNC